MDLADEEIVSVLKWMGYEVRKEEPFLGEWEWGLYKTDSSGKTVRVDRGSTYKSLLEARLQFDKPE